LEVLTLQGMVEDMRAKFGGDAAEAFKQGFEIGYKRGRADGCADGYQHGDEEGYERGFGDGYERGYGKGRDGEAFVRDMASLTDAADPQGRSGDGDDCSPEGMVRPTL